MKEPASTFKIVGCAFAGPYSNGDSVGITAADDSQQNAASLATSEYADLQKSHGGCVWDYAEAAFHCNPLPGAPAAAATVLVVGSQHVWNVQLWATTQTKLTVARSAIEVYLGSR